MDIGPEEETIIAVPEKPQIPQREDTPQEAPAPEREEEREEELVPAEVD